MHAGWLLLLLLRNGAGGVVAPEGPMVCPYVKSFTNPRLFVTNEEGEYIVSGECEPAPEQTVFVGIRGRCGVIVDTEIKGRIIAPVKGVLPFSPPRGRI